MKWISIKDKLPKNDRSKVLGYSHITKHYYLVESKDFNFVGITQWMFLPKP